VCVTLGYIPLTVAKATRKEFNIMNYVELLDNPLVAILIIAIICGLAVLLAYVSEKHILSAKAEGIVSFDPVEDPKDVEILQLRKELEETVRELKVVKDNLGAADYELWATAVRIRGLKKELEISKESRRADTVRWDAAVEASRLRGRALRAELSELRARLQSLDGLKTWAGNTQLTSPSGVPQPMHLKEVRRAKVTMMVALSRLSPDLKRKLGL
jgi:hypothetical protein